MLYIKAIEAWVLKRAPMFLRGMAYWQILESNYSYIIMTNYIEYWTTNTKTKFEKPFQMCWYLVQWWHQHQNVSAQRWRKDLLFFERGSKNCMQKLPFFAKIGRFGLTNVRFNIDRQTGTRKYIWEERDAPFPLWHHHWLSCIISLHN